MDSISTSSLRAIADAPTSDLIRMAQGAGSLSSLKHGRRHHGRRHHGRHHRAHTYSTSSLGRRPTSSLLREVGAGSSLSPRRAHTYSTSSLGRRPTSSLLREVGGSALPSTSSLVMSLGPTTSSLRRSRSGHSHAHRALKHALAVANARV
jgi:hypothetical protein